MKNTQASPAWLARIPSPQVRGLDSRRHALIEASAGTGKTFAIERLVLRLLVENPSWNPEEILLLSFTEKTVAELRDRIRRLLRAQIDDSDPENRITGWSNDDLDRIRKAWLHADDLSIHTLHAFCQSAVHRDPVANDTLIRTELADDRSMADVALDGLMRGPWTADPGRLARLSEALGIGAGDAWKHKLIRIVLTWQPWRHDTLDPERDPGTLETVEAAAVAAVRALPQAIAAVDRGGYPVAEHRNSFGSTPTGRARKNPEEHLNKDPWQKVFLFAGERPSDPADPAREVETVLEFFRTTFRGNMRVVRYGWEPELPAGAQGRPEWKAFAATCQAVRDACDALAAARRQRDLGLLAEAATELRAALDAEKQRRGFISYDDMPRRLIEAMRNNPALARRLRSRYKACIVDEFQDTDPLQWEILERLCLHESPEGKTDDRESPPLPSLPLFLVGDPKQAIYAFRGGDLRTYMRARDRFLELAAGGRAQGIGLDANYRSRPVLIDALNAVFAHPGWFGPPPDIPANPAWRLPGATDGIAFTPVRPGRPDADSGRDPAIVLRDFSATSVDEKGREVWPRKAEIEHKVRGWIAARIAGAIRGGARPGDHAVLTRGNAEGEAIARLLLRRGVPCRIRRRGGPFHGPAADALRLLLEWIGDAASPDAQARILLLPFARARRAAADLPKGRPEHCPPLIARWAALARAGRWPEFLASVLHEGGYRDRLAAASRADAARFDRLVQILSEAGAFPGITARALCDRFDALRRGEEAFDVDEGDEGIQGDRGAKDGVVSVMTLHLGKGLEFPHVFVAATGGGGRDDFLVLRDSGAPGFRIALDTQEEERKHQAEGEAEEEEKRLYYVAFTRAKETLHVPLLPQKFSRAISGPLGGFAADALRALTERPETRSLARFDSADIREITIAAVPRSGDEGAGAPDRNALTADTRAAFARKRRVASYSSLAHHAGTNAGIAGDDPLLEEDGTRARREETPATPEAPDAEATGGRPSAPGITAGELPPGASTGTVLHALLEHTSFASALEAESPEAWLELAGNRVRVEESLRRESVDPVHASAAARAVWNALRAPIPDPAERNGTTFRLADLAPENLRHEVEFLLPFRAPGKTVDVDALPEEIARRGTFLWGFIDLVFRRGERYYLLDWKSNLLPSYDRESVLRSMKQHRYDLQWKLYAVALHRWLSARLDGYDPGAHFGGVCYLYLRGTSAAGGFSGFTERPRPEDLREAYPREILALLGGARGAA